MKNQIFLKNVCNSSAKIIKKIIMMLFSNKTFSFEVFKCQIVFISFGKLEN